MLEWLNEIILMKHSACTFELLNTCQLFLVPILESCCFGFFWGGGNSGHYVPLVMSFFATLCRKAHLWKSWLSQMSLGKYVNSSWSLALECKSYIKRISTLSFISYHECVLKSEFTIIHVNRIYFNIAEKSFTKKTISGVPF